MRFLADFITNMCGFRFPIPTGQHNGRACSSGSEFRELTVFARAAEVTGTCMDQMRAPTGHTLDGHIVIIAGSLLNLIGDPSVRVHGRAPAYKSGSDVRILPGAPVDLNGLCQIGFVRWH